MQNIICMLKPKRLDWRIHAMLEAGEAELSPVRAAILEKASSALYRYVSASALYSDAPHKYSRTD